MRVGLLITISALWMRKMRRRCVLGPHIKRRKAVSMARLRRERRRRISGIRLIQSLLLMYGMWRSLGHSRDSSVRSIDRFHRIRDLVLRLRLWDEAGRR